MATFWSYVRIQAMVLVCGIVGPIFLLGYFGMQPDPTVRWMYWWGLILTAIDVVIALVVTRAVEVQREHGNDAGQRAVSS